MDRAVTRRVDDADRGSATILVLGVVGVAMALLLGLGAVAGAQSSRGAAQSAADLAALAGAAAALAGSESACERVREVAERNAARLEGCEQLAGSVVDVRVSRSAGPGVPGRAQASARAGPVWMRGVVP